MKKIISSLLTLSTISLLACTNQSLATETTSSEQATMNTITNTQSDIIKRVQSAYGGEKLNALESVRILTNRELAWPGQGQTADFVEFVSDRFDIQLDFKAEKGSMERWTKQNGNVYSGRQVTTAEGVASIDYFTDTYSVADSAGFMNDFGWVIPSSDTLLAFSLVNDAHDVSFLTPQMYQGTMYDRVSFKTTPEASEGTVYIDQSTGLIARYSTTRPYGTWNTLFSKYSQDGGIAYATQKLNFRNDKMIRYAMGIKMEMNSVKSSIFTVEANLTQQAEQVDMSEMTVEEIAPNVFHVGKDGGYSTFVDAGDYIIGFNAYAGLSERFTAFQESRNISKPLKYMVLSHHHSDHLDGVPDAITLGATIVTTPMTIKTLQADETLPSFQSQSLGAKTTLGPVDLYVVETSHVVELAISYLPEQKLLYQDDHYNNTSLNTLARVNQPGLVMKDQVDALGLEVDWLVSGHSRKAERWSDFEAAAAKTFKGDICPKARAICR